MNQPSRLSIPLLSLGALAALAVNAGCSRAVADLPRPIGADLELTVYKDDFALVHDTRPVNLSAGQDRIQLPGVSKELDPNSVMFDWPSGGEHPDVVSTTYNMGVDSSQALMKRLVGQSVDVVWRGQDGKESDRVSGRLEEAGQGTVLHTKDGYLIDPSGEVVVPGDRSFPTMPELIAKVQNGSQVSTKLGMSYLTRGLSWSADYVAVLAPDGKSMKLECWGTVSNQTGTDFPAAKLQLVAGNPNRAITSPGALSAGTPNLYLNNVAKSVDAGRAVMNSAPPMAIGDLYTYDIKSAADISQGQMNRVRIFHGASVPIVTRYSIALSPWMESEQRQSAQVSIAFTNSASSGLGLPLPAGALRAYDSGGTESYVGAADIGDTPKDEHLNLTLSEAFDVYAKSRQTAFRRVAKRAAAISYETVVHNEKKTDVDVRVSQQFNGPIKVLDESIPSRSLNLGELQWTVHVKAGDRATLRYTVRMGA